MYAVAYETSSLIHHAKPVCYVCYRCLFSLSLEEYFNFVSNRYCKYRKLCIELAVSDILYCY